jgi:hypothetical protein
LTDIDSIGRQVELLHAYHLNLWTEVEAQLRVLRSAQDEISKLRDARVAIDSPDTARDSARMLARHVQTLKGRVNTLGSTVHELEGTVGELTKLLAV